MRALLFVGVLAIAAVAAALLQTTAAPVAKSRDEGEAKMAKQVDVDLDEKSALQIAEIVLVRVYGEKVLKERPWNSSKAEGVFEIWGTMKKTELGGVASIRISAADARVISIEHGK